MAEPDPDTAAAGVSTGDTDTVSDFFFTSAGSAMRAVACFSLDITFTAGAGMTGRFMAASFGPNETAGLWGIALGSTFSTGLGAAADFTFSTGFTGIAFPSLITGFIILGFCCGIATVLTVFSDAVSFITFAP
ncbi:MAG: hypothetical protein EOL87_05450 [Spartobacteria bacterium]|nr:hypothetical protein [Spartobacteria bacterium]